MLEHLGGELELSFGLLAPSDVQDDAGRAQWRAVVVVFSPAAYHHPAFLAIFRAHDTKFLFERLVFVDQSSQVADHVVTIVRVNDRQPTHSRVWIIRINTEDAVQSRRTVPYIVGKFGNVAADPTRYLRVSQALFAGTQRRLHLFSHSLSVEIFQRVADVISHFYQQVANRFVKKITLGRIQCEHSDDVAASVQWQCSHGSPADQISTLTPECGGRVMLKILAPVGSLFAYRDSYRTPPTRFIDIHRDVNTIQIVCAGSELCDRNDLAGQLLHFAYPRHIHAAKLYGIVANQLEQFILAGAAHDGLIALAQRRIKLGQPLYLCLVQLAQGDVARKHNETRRLPGLDRFARNGKLEPEIAVR